MISNPLVSIVTPSYNQGHFLEDTILSVINQNYANIEYIIIDGGSTDCTIDIIHKYEHKLTYWISEKDTGQSQAINKGLMRAQGEIIGWINSDDCLLPNSISTIVDTFNAFDDVGMVFGNIEIIDREGRLFKEHVWKDYSVVDQLTQRMYIPQPGSFWRREVMQSVGLLREDLHYAMDYEYWIRIGQRFKIMGINTLLAQYRHSSVNKGNTQADSWGAEFLRILDEMFAQKNLPDILQKTKRAAYAGAYFRGAEGFLTQADLSNARRWFLKSIRLDPRLALMSSWWKSLFKTLLPRGSYIRLRSLKRKITTDK
jgi:glycosyltransferase involved in cell wall biosynthesis